MKIKIVLYNFVIFIFLFLIFDFLFSNLYLNKLNTSCYHIEEDYYELKKNCKGREQFKPSFPTVDINTNEFGHRISDIKNSDQTKKSKVFIFGDSFTYGLGVDYEDSFMGIIEKKQSNYDFYNFAVPSYSPTVHLYKFKQAIKENFTPDRVIVFLDLTDIFDEGSRWNIKDDDQKPYLVYDEFKEKNFDKKFTHKNFKFSKAIISNLNFNMRKIRQKINIKFKKNYNKVKTSFQASFTYKDINEFNNSFWSENVFNKGISKIENNIKEISNICKEKNIKFDLVIFPWAETLVYGQKSFNWETFGEKICDKSKCNFINTFPFFEQIKKENKFWANDLYFVNDQHFNKNGNKVLADILIDQLFF